MNRESVFRQLQLVAFIVFLFIQSRRFGRLD